jgi:hypothetical protein
MTLYVLVGLLLGLALTGLYVGVEIKRRAAPELSHAIELVLSSSGSMAGVKLLVLSVTTKGGYDVDLAAVADVYRAAVAAGQPPILAVADHCKLSRRTAQRRVDDARKAGLLGAALRRRAGEAVAVGGSLCHPVSSERRRRRRGVGERLPSGGDRSHAELRRSGRVACRTRRPERFGSPRAAVQSLSRAASPLVVAEGWRRDEDMRREGPGRRHARAHVAHEELFHEMFEYGWDEISFDEDSVRSEQLMKMDLSDREAFLDALVDTEFPQDVAWPRKRPKTAPKWLRDLVDDWLYDPHGRGAASGLPMTS